MSYEFIHSVQNVWYFQMTELGPEDDVDVEDALAAWLDNVYSNVVVDQAASFKYDRIDFYNVTQDRPMVSRDWPTLTAGTGAGLADALQLAGQVNFRTGVKRSLGKKYIGGYTDASISGGGYLNPAPIANMEAFGADACANVGPGNSIWRAGHVKASNGAFVTWVDAYAMAIVATQRRRKLGVGV
jgi:hypothetical protein